jgi:uncharacterized protein YdiU (UPF0061 family)
MGAWNLSRLAESLLPLLHENRSEAEVLAKNEISIYWEKYNENFLHGMCEKLGIAKENSEETIAKFLSTMVENKQDFTSTFHSLPHGQKTNPAVIPRNHLVEEALSAAEHGDFAPTHSLLDALRNPFNFHEKFSPPPKQPHCKYKTFCGT